MKLSCTKYMLFLAVGLLLLGLAACTQAKATPIPATSVPSGPPILPQSGTPAGTPGLIQGTPLPAATLVNPGTPVAGQTPGAGQTANGGTSVPGPAATQPATGPIVLPTPTPFGGTQPGSTQPGATPTTGTQPGGTQAGAACDNPYVVQRGEWLYSIARKCGVTPGAIIAANPMVDPNNIYPGQSLVMPGGGSTTGGSTTGGGTTSGGGASSGNTYVVQPGDNLYRIALKYNVSIYALMQANGISNPNYIFAGQVLTIP
ncbi:MAG: LysM peptidoglycan-binding domain-containing protein [Anaerolineae bacterium]